MFKVIKTAYNFELVGADKFRGVLAFNSIEAAMKYAESRGWLVVR